MADASNPYTLGRTEGVLDTLARILLDVHLRLARSEARDGIIDEGARAIADRGTAYIESVMLPLVAQLNEAFDNYRAGIPASAVVESAERRFVTAAVLATLAPVAHRHAMRDVEGLLAALGNDTAFAATTALALDARLRLDAAQALSAGQKTTALTNLGFSSDIRSFLAALNFASARNALDLGTFSNVEFNGLRTKGAGDNDYVKMQHVLMGGGIVSWGGNGGRLKWTARFICPSVSNASAAFRYVEINQPTADIPASQVYDAVDRSVTADGILLKAWDGLYAAHTVGGNHVAHTLRIVNLGTNAVIPPNWILIGVVNGDDYTLRLGNGQILRPGQSRNFSQKEPYAIAEVTGLQGALDTKATKGVNQANTFGDLNIDRGNGSGVLNFGSGTSKQFYNDSSNWALAGSGELYINNNIAWHDGRAAGTTTQFGDTVLQRFPCGWANAKGSVILTLDANGRGFITCPFVSPNMWFVNPGNGDYNVNPYAPIAGQNNTSGSWVQFPNSANGTVRANIDAWTRWR